MTNEEIEQELSGHLENASKDTRNQVFEDVEYKLARKAGNVSAAYQRAYAIIYGMAKNKAQIKSVMKK